MNVRHRIGKSPGLLAREAELDAAQQDAGASREAGGLMRGALGSLGARQRIVAAQRALKRQQQFASGHYPSGR